MRKVTHRHTADKRVLMKYFRTRFDPNKISCFLGAAGRAADLLLPLLLRPPYHGCGPPPPPLPPLSLTRVPPSSDSLTGAPPPPPSTRWASQIGPCFSWYSLRIARYKDMFLNRHFDRISMDTMWLDPPALLWGPLSIEHAIRTTSKASFWPLHSGRSP